MPKQNIIVIGASAGGVEALQTLVAGFPPDLDASIFVVLHIGRGTDGQSHLPEILARAGPLSAQPARHEAYYQKATIYVAPPDCHLLIRRNQIHLSHGPKENRTRPAINPLFRSAAEECGGQVAGVLLTGLLDDGVAGLAEIKRRGGIAVVEDPATALFPDMPKNAMKRVEVDYVLPLPQIAPLLSRLTIEDRPTSGKEEPVERKTSGLTCPECRGPLTEERQGKIVEFSCRVGHRYTPLSMEDEHHDTVERTLWSAVVALEEAADIADRLSPDLGGETSRNAAQNRKRAAIIRNLLGEMQKR
jgi:two-component system chemotaxis response regulator CheB